MDAVADVTFAGAEASATFGWSVAGFGNVDGGWRDVVIGAPLDDADGNATEDALDAGRVFFYTGGTGLLDNTADAVIDGNQNAAESGSYRTGWDPPRDLQYNTRGSS